MSNKLSLYHPATSNEDTNAFLDHIFEGKLLPKHLIKSEKDYKKFMNIGIDNGMFKAPLDPQIKIILGKDITYTISKSNLDFILYTLKNENRECPKELLELYGYYITNKNQVHNKDEKKTNVSENIVVLPFSYYEDIIEKNTMPSKEIKDLIISSTHCLFFGHTSHSEKLCLYDLTNVSSQMRKVKFFYIFLCFFAYFCVFLHMFMFFCIFLCCFTYFYVFLHIFIESIDIEIEIDQMYL